MPIVAANHLLYDIFTTTDSQGPGTAALSWTIRGTRPNGQHWSLVRSDRVAATDVVALEAGQMLLDQLIPIAQTTTERVRFDSVAIACHRQSHGQGLHHHGASGCHATADPGSRWTPSSPIPGDALRFKVTLRDLKGIVSTAVVGVPIPSDASGDGSVVIGTSPGGPGSDCFDDPSACPTTFGRLLASLRDAPRQDDLLVTTSLTAFDGTSRVITRSTRLDKVVEGSIELPIEIQ